MTKEELFEKLNAKLVAGEISPEEAEHEYQDLVNPELRYCGGEW